MAILFCTTSAEFQTALNTAVAGDTIRLDHTKTFNEQFLVRNRGAIPAGSEIIVESDTPTAQLPPPGYRTNPSYSNVLAKIQGLQLANRQNEQCLTIETQANGYIFQNLQFDPNIYGSQAQVTIGFNDSTQTEYFQIPYNIKFDRCFFRGHPLSGHKLAIINHGNGTKIHNCYFKDYKGYGQDAAPIGGGNYNGTFEVINCHLEGAGYGFLLGGSDLMIRTIATVSASPAPTTTQATVSSIKDLSIGQMVAILVGNNTARRHPKVTAIDSATKRITFDAIDLVPDVPGDIRWGTNPTGLIFRRNHIIKPLEWRDPILFPEPVASGASVVPAATGLAAGTYYIAIKAVHDAIGYQQNIYYSKKSNESTFVVTVTSELHLSWTATPNATKYRVYRYQKDGSGNKINRKYYDVPSTTLSYVDTDAAGGIVFNDTGNDPFQLTSQWTVKNLFELKVGSNNQIDSNIMENTWYSGGGDHAVWIKVNNQDGEHEFAQVDNVIFEWNIMRHTPGHISHSTQRTNGDAPRDFPKKPVNWQVRNCLVYDSSNYWVNAGINAGVYGLHLTGAGDDFVYDHNTFIHTPNTSGFMYIDVNPTAHGYWTNIKHTNNIFLQEAFGLHADTGSGKDALAAASNNTYDFNKNVIADGLAGSYTIPGKTNYTPDAATFQAQFKSYGAGVTGDYRLKRISEGDSIDSLYINLGTDGKDIGCDVKTLNTKLTGVIEGTPEGTAAGTFVRASRQATNLAGGTDVAIDVPTGTVVGDVVQVIIHANGQATTIVDNNGATAYTEDLAHITQVSHTFSVFSRRFQSGDPTTLHFTLGTIQRYTATTIAIANPHPSVIYDVAPVYTLLPVGANTSLAAQSVTTATDNAIHFAAVLLDGITKIVTGTPAGYTVDQNGGDMATAVVHKTISPAGATGAQTFTFNIPDGAASISWAIRSAAVTEIALTGKQAVGSVGSVAVAAPAVALTGVSASTARGTVAVGGGAVTPNILSRQTPYASSASPTIDLPTGTAVGDVVLIFVHFNFPATTCTDNNGSTPFAEDFNRQITSNEVSVFSRRIQSGDPTTLSFLLDSAQRVTLTAVTIKNTDSTYYDVMPTDLNAQTSPVNAPDITTTQINVLHFACAFADGSSVPITSTPAGYTVLENGGTMGSAVTYKLIPSPAATGAQTFAAPTVNTGFIGISLGIRLSPATAVTTSLTGVAATVIANTPKNTPSVALAGKVATGSVGSVGFNITFPTIPVTDNPDPVYTFIDNVEQKILAGWTINATTNGNDSVNAQVQSLDGTYRPALDKEIILINNGQRIFGGTIGTADESGIESPGGTSIKTRLAATSFDDFASRRWISVTIPATTLKVALQTLVPFLAPYGVTLDPLQQTGPTLPDLKYDYRQMSEIFKELVTLSNFVQEIDYDKVLRMFPVGSSVAPFTISPGDGNVEGDVTIGTSRTNSQSQYANRVIVRGGTTEAPITAIAEDLAEQALRQLWEVAVASPTATDQATAQALADAYLAQRLPRAKTVKYMTRRKGLRPGMTQSINVPTRNFNNVCMLTEVAIKSDRDHMMSFDITAIEGSTYQGSWRNLYQQWTGGLPNVFTVPGAAGQKVAYFLGGSLVEYVQSPTPDTWVPASAVQVQIDTVARGTTNATVHVRMRAAEGNVTSRLMNVTDSIQVGVSSVVTSSSFQTVVFPVVLTPGNKTYELQVLPSQVDTDVSAVGYLE